MMSPRSDKPGGELIKSGVASRAGLSVQIGQEQRGALAGYADLVGSSLIPGGEPVEFQGWLCSPALMAGRLPYLWGTGTCGS